MTIKKFQHLFGSLVLTAVSMAFASAIHGQSTSMDKPTEVKQNVIEGEGDGKAETLYYYIDVTKGTLKVIVDAKTDDRSTPLRVTLMDEDGKELLPIYVVATGSGKREAGSRKIVKGMRIVIKIATQDDPQVNHLTYKIRFNVPESVPDATPSASETFSVPPDTNSSAEPPAAPPAATTETQAAHFSV